MIRFQGGPATFLFSDAVAALRSPIESRVDPDARTVGSNDAISDGTIDLDELYFKPWVSSTLVITLGT